MTRIRITEDHGPRLNGQWVRVRTGQEFGVPADITEGDASAWVRAGFAEVVEMGGEARPGPAPDANEGEAEADVDLRETPLRDLDDALAEIEDVDVLRTLLESDDRKGARERIEARMAALE